jgi:hypothetical protein
MNKNAMSDQLPSLLSTPKAILSAPRNQWADESVVDKIAFEMKVAQIQLEASQVINTYKSLAAFYEKEVLRLRQALLEAYKAQQV